MFERIIKYIRYYIPDLAIDIHEAEELAALLNAKEAVFAKGEVIFPFRSDGLSCLFLEQGLVREYYLFDDKEVNLRLLCRGGVVLAYSAYLKQQPSEYCIEAVDDVKGISFSMPATSDFINNILLQRIKLLLAQQHFISMERRLRMLQHKRLEDKYHFFLREMEQPIVENMPDYHVASYLGVSPESLSRMKSQLNKC